MGACSPAVCLDLRIRGSVVPGEAFARGLKAYQSIFELGVAIHGGAPTSLRRLSIWHVVSISCSDGSQRRRCLLHPVDR